MAMKLRSCKLFQLVQLSLKSFKAKSLVSMVSSVANAADIWKLAILPVKTGDFLNKVKFSKAFKK